MHHANDGSGLTPPARCPAHGPGLDGLRLYGPEAEADPAGLYEKLRQQYGPVAPVLVHGDLPAWLVVGHRENLQVMRTPSLFSRDSRRWSAFIEGKVPEDSPLLPSIAWQPLCVFTDGEEHAKLRGAVTDSLARFDRHGMRRYVIRYTKQLVDGFAARGKADLVTEFAEQLPLLVMTQLLGMPEDYGPQLAEAVRDMLKGSETALGSNQRVVETLRELVERKKHTPGNDFATWLISHKSELTDEEVIEHLRLVLVAANETTVNLITNTLRMVLTDHRFRAHLSGGHMTLPDALEQVLWDASPLSVVPGRWATGDTELGGKQIKAGDMLLLGLAAGNVDPEIRPDLSVPVHGNRSHLAFSSGPHECPGQDIGRAIADTGIDTLLTLLPDLQLAVPESELPTKATWLTKHLLSLPAAFTPPRSKNGHDALAVNTELAHQPLPPAVSAPVAERTSPAPADGSPTPRSPWRWLSILRRRR